MDDDSFSKASYLVNNETLKRKTSIKESLSKKRSLSSELYQIFTLEEIKAEVRFWKQFVDFVRGRSSVSNRSTYFNRICGLCLAQTKEQKWLIKFRKTGLRRLNQFLLNNTRREVQSKDVKLLTWCCLSLLSFYYSKHQQGNDCTCFRQHKFDQSKAVLRNAMYLILPEKQNEVIKYTIRYVTITKQWNIEDYDSFIFQELFTMITKPELLLAKIIKQMENSQKEGAIKEALNISSTLSTILEHAYWDKYLFNHLLHNCFNTLLKVYLLCNSPIIENSMKIDNAKFRIVIKSCIKYFISNIKDNKGLVSVMDSIAKCLHDNTIISEDRLEITEMIGFAAQRYQTTLFRESVTPDLLDLLLNNLKSYDRNLAMISHKIFHHLLDRHGNTKHFTEPIYYFKGRSDFTINYDYGIEDIHFFKSFSKRFFDGIRHCFSLFSDKYELVAFYITLCLVLVEIPEPVITINIIQVIITTQNDALKRGENLSITVRAHIHAIVAALMSLICLIHQEEVNSLMRYVEEVVRFRTENSPYLLPPLQNKYTVAGHHTTEYHDQLYFLEEEVLYYLQRCWLGRRHTESRIKPLTEGK